MKYLLLLVFASVLLAEPCSIQWGAFDSVGAQKLVDSLKRVDIPVYTQRAVVKEREFTRVRTGPFTDIAEAQRAAALINISTPYLAAEPDSLPIDVESLLPKSFAGMIPVVIRDSITMPRDSCDRPFCFGYPQYRKVQLNELMEQFYAGFYDPENGRVISLFEGINKITPLLKDDHYLMIRKFTGWGPGAFHPKYQSNYLYKTGDKLVETALNLGHLNPVKNGFYGVEGKGTFTFELLNTPVNQRPSDTLCFSLEGERTDSMPVQPVLPVSLHNRKVTGGGWEYTLPDTGTLYAIGKGRYAVVVVKTSSDDFDECCSVCHSYSEVYLFDKDGFISIVPFPVSRKISPFFIELHEDPCSA